MFGIHRLFKSKSYGKENKDVVFMLTGWGSTITQFFIFSKILEMAGFYCITYAYGKEIIDTDVKKTVRNFNQVKKDILEKIEYLKRKGHENFYLFGTSLGTFISFMVANHSKDVKRLIADLTGADLAEIAWNYKDYKNDLRFNLIRQGITLKELRKEWAPLSPINNLKNLKDKKILIYISKQDEVIPYLQGLKLVKKFEQLKLDYKLIINKKSDHYLSAMNNMFNFKLYLKFLRE